MQRELGKVNWTKIIFYSGQETGLKIHGEEHLPSLLSWLWLKLQMFTQGVHIQICLCLREKVAKAGVFFSGVGVAGHMTP